MAVRPVTFYQVVCDRCGYVDDEGDYAAWADADQAQQVAADSEWLVAEFPNQKHYCPECYEWDEEKDERVPKAPQVVLHTCGDPRCTDPEHLVIADADYGGSVLSRGDGFNPNWEHSK